eukprot:m51a1_g4465 hypothetical protein (333) ;mRNA; r:206478-211694
MTEALQLHQHEFGAAPSDLDRIAPQRGAAGVDAPYMWVSSDNVTRGSQFAIGVVVPASWMGEHGLGPEHIRRAALDAVVVRRGAKETSVPVSCPKCCTRSGRQVIEVGSAMYESFCSSTVSDPQSSPSREFIFGAPKTSSRLHIGGKVELVMQIRDPGDIVVATLRSVPICLLSKPPRSRATCVCSRCCSGGRPVVDLGGVMFESYGQSPRRPELAQATREFIFDSAKTSSRLHLGGRVALVMEIRDSDNRVQATLHSPLPQNVHPYELLLLQPLQLQQLPDQLLVLVVDRFHRPTRPQSGFQDAAHPLNFEYKLDLAAETALGRHALEAGP